MIQKVIIIPGLLTSTETLASGIFVYLMIYIYDTHAKYVLHALKLPV